MGLAERALKNFSEIFDGISAEPSVRIGPWSLIFSSFALAISTSFSKGLLPPLISIIFLAFLAPTFRTLPRIMAMAAGFTLLLTLPMALLSRFEPMAIASLIMRVSAASGLLALAALSTGVKGLRDGLLSLGFRPTWVASILLFLKFLPVMARTTYRALIAREARALDRRAKWAVLSSVVGDAIVRGYERAFRLRMAMEARGAFLYERKRPEAGLKEVLLTAGSLVASALFLAL